MDMFKRHLRCYLLIKRLRNITRWTHKNVNTLILTLLFYERATKSTYNTHCYNSCYNWMYIYFEDENYGSSSTITWEIQILELAKQHSTHMKHPVYWVLLQHNLNLLYFKEIIFIIVLSNKVLLHNTIFNAAVSQ